MENFLDKTGDFAQNILKCRYNDYDQNLFSVLFIPSCYSHWICRNTNKVATTVDIPIVRPLSHGTNGIVCIVARRFSIRQILPYAKAQDSWGTGDMAKNKKPVWAMDIGNTSLKALQCRIGDEPGTMEALAFDYIEHSKILSQPGAEPGELLAESLETFLSRNNVQKSRVAISVSGQNTISRFLKLPPVDKKKLPDIIRLEAKQWLPFALDDVIWDYQPLIGGSMHGNTLVDSEIGMFALKREFAARALVPFERAGIPVDCIQSTPLALYNFAVFDQFDLTQLQGTEEGGTKGFNNYTVILCLGTDSSDVVITNGIKIWVRNITIGGNNFTKALTKGMKLTFSNAEHLKRNAAASQDPKAVFQVLRPIYNELLTEVNRSLEFYSNLDRKAKYGKMIALGSSTKLPGLCQFLRQNFGFEVAPLKKYNKLVGEEILATPAFIENINSFGICYGLALQMLGESAIATNLIPSEVVTRRIIAEKKPWLLAGAASLMLGLIVPFMSVSKAYTPLQAQAMISAENAAKNVQSTSSKLTSDFGSVETNFNKIDEIGGTITGNVEGRIRWPEFYHVLQSALPQNQPGAMTTGTLALQDRIYVTNIEVQKMDDLSSWWDMVKSQPPGAYVLDKTSEAEFESASAASGGSDTSGDSGTVTSDSPSSSSPTSSTSPASTPTPAGDSETPVTDMDGTGINLAKAPEGEGGYIVQLSIYHFHNPVPGMTDEAGNPVTVDFKDIGAAYVRRTLFHNLRHNVVQLPSSLSKQSFSSGTPVNMETVTMQEFGFSHPVLLDFDPLAVERTIVDPAVLQKAVEDAIMQERTKIRRTPGGIPGGQGSTRYGSGGTMGGSSMAMYGSDAFSTTMGIGGGGLGGIGDYVSPQNVLISLAMSGGGMSGSTTTMGGMNQGTSNVLNMLKLQLKPEEKLDVRKFEAVIQFVWFPKTPTEREAVKAEKLKAQMEAEAAQATDKEMTGNETGIDAANDVNTEIATVDTNANSEPSDIEPTVTDETP